jgi:predicted ATPase
MPYHPFISALKNGIQNLDNKFLTTLSVLANRNGINLSGSLPFIKSFLSLSDEPISLLNKEQLWNAIFLFFQTVAADKPLVLILEDLQWADKTTLGLFSYISRNSTNLPLLLIGIHRPPEIKVDDKAELNPLIEIKRQLNIEELAIQIILERLTIEDTEILVSKLFNSKAEGNLVRKIFQHTEGNPLFISELIKLMKDKNFVKFENGKWRLENNKSSFALTEKVQDVIQQRVDRLEKDLHEILEFASCEGEYFQSDTLTSCLKIPKIPLLKSLNVLEKEYHLIKHEKNRYKFDHILIKEVLYKSILDELRDEYHRMIAGYFISQYSANDELASIISYHLLASGENEKAVNYLIRAAKRAKELHATEDAMNYYQKVDSILKRIKSSDISLLLKTEEGLGDMHSLMGNTKTALERFNKYLQISRDSNNHVEEIRALRKISEVLQIQGRINEAFNLCNSALELAKTTNSKQELVHCINTMAFIYASKGQYNLTIELSSEAHSLAVELNDSKNQSISQSNIGFAYWHIGNYPFAMEYLNHALKLQRSIGDSLGLSTTLNFLGMAYWKLGEYKKALQSEFESVKIKKSIADFRKIPGSLNVIGDIYREINDINKAIEFHSDSLSLAREHQNKGAMCDNIRDLGEDYFLLGKIDEALKYFEEVLQLAQSSGITWYETRTYLSLSELYNFIGNIEKASHYSDLGLEYAKKINAKDLIIEALWNQAKVKSKNESNSRVDEIKDLFISAIELAESIGHSTFLWQLYKDFSKFLADNFQTDEMNIYRNKSKKVLSRILDNLDSELKNTFMQSANVKEVLNYEETHS